MLRHTLATLAYRGAKAVKGAPPEFAHFKPGSSTRTPVEILAHIGDLMDWAVCLADGRHEWHDAPPLPWDQEIARFHRALETLDRRLASLPLKCTEGQLFQGPIADALTHVGQITMLRRMAGVPIRGENYFKADIASGRVTAEQSKPVYEFD
jgi:hypothetical protein